MQNNRRWLYFAASVFFLASLSQCGSKKGKSDGAEFVVLPDRPIVILGDSADSQGKVIKAPWFSYRLTMTNNTAQPVTIVALVLTLNEEDDSGTQVQTNVSASPSDFNFTLNDVSSTPCTFSSFGTWAVGESKSLTLDNNITQCKGFPVFFVGDNKKGSSGQNFRYRVVVKPAGWFGTYDVPLDRFDKQFSFYTQ